MVKRKRTSADDVDVDPLTFEMVKNQIDIDSMYIVASYCSHYWNDDRLITYHHPSNDMLIFLRRIQYNCNSNMYSLIVSNVAQECDLNRLKLALSLCTDVTVVSSTFDTICSYGHLPSVEYMVERYNISKDLVEMNGSRALWWACSAGRMDVVRYLVTRFRLTRDEGNLSLVYASGNGHLNIVKYLVETFCLTVQDVMGQKRSHGSPFTAACTSVTYAHSQFHLSGGPHNQEKTWKHANQFGILQYYTQTFTIPLNSLNDGAWALMCRDGLLDRIQHLVKYFNVPSDPLPHWLSDAIYLSTRELQHLTVAFLISHFRLNKSQFELLSPHHYIYPETISSVNTI